MNNIPN